MWRHRWNSSSTRCAVRMLALFRHAHMLLAGGRSRCLGRHVGMVSTGTCAGCATDLSGTSRGSRRPSCTPTPAPASAPASAPAPLAAPPIDAPLRWNDGHVYSWRAALRRMPFFREYYSARRRCRFPLLLGGAGRPGHIGDAAAGARRGGLDRGAYSCAPGSRSKHLMVVSACCAGARARRRKGARARARLGRGLRRPS